MGLAQARPNYINPPSPQIYTPLCYTTAPVLSYSHFTLAKLGRCLQHRGGEPEQAKDADGMQPFALDCIAHIVDAEMDRVFACMNDM